MREHPLWQARGSLPDDEGVGMAAGYWPGGNEPAAAVCRVGRGRDDDGHHVGGRHERRGHGVRRHRGCRRSASPPTRCASSRQIPQRAPTPARAEAPRSPTPSARRCRTQPRPLARSCSRPHRRSSRSLPTTWRWSTASCARSAHRTARSRSQEISGKALRFGGRYEPIEGHGGSAQTRGAPSVAAHLSHVRVDKDTGEVKLLSHVIAQDVGRALNPALVEGQMRGGAGTGDRLGALRGAATRRGRAAPQRLVPRVRDTDRRTSAGDRHAHRRGTRARRAVRREGHRRSARRRSTCGDRERRRGGVRRAAA